MACIERKDGFLVCCETALFSLHSAKWHEPLGRCWLLAL